MTFQLLEVAIPAPTFEFRSMAPVVLVFLAACLGVLVEAVVPRSDDRVSRSGADDDEVVVTVGHSGSLACSVVRRLARRMVSPTR